MISINKLWDFLSKDTTKGESITIPLINTQHGRNAELTREVVIKQIIDTFIDSSKYNSICEVTMLTGRDQWYNEGQPVMRHLRNFEDINDDKPSYCIFVAPRMHQDTINTFWFATKYEYEGTKQKIIPFTINQLVEILKILIKIKQANKILKHTDIKDLFDNVVKITENVNSSGEWLNEIPNVITQWENQIV